MIIRRANRTTYTTLANEIVNDERLSYDALGLLTYLLSRPDDWEVNVDQLRTRKGLGKHKIYKIVGELQEAGYLKHERVYENGKVAYGFWQVTEQPEVEQNSTSVPETDLHPENRDEELHPENLNEENLNLENRDGYKGLIGTKSLREGAPTRERGKPIRFLAPDDSEAKAAFEKIAQAWERGAKGGAGAIGNPAKALAALADLQPDDRASAVERAPRYLRSLITAKRGYTPAIETYVVDRIFDHHPPPAAEKPVEQVTLEPFSKALSAMLWTAAAAALGGNERARRETERLLPRITRGLTTVATAVPSEDSMLHMVAVQIGSDDHRAWVDYAARIGFPSLPRPDHVPVIWVPAKRPPSLKTDGYRPYSLAHGADIEWRGKAWWWQIHRRVAGGGRLVTVAGRHRVDVLEDARRTVGNSKQEFGPLPTQAELDAMVEVKQLGPEWEDWRHRFHDLGTSIDMWPDSSIWCLSRYPEPLPGNTGADIEALDALSLTGTD